MILSRSPMWNKETDSNNCKTPCPQILVINALWSVLTGQSLDEDDPVVKSIYKAVSDIGDLSGTPLFLLAILVPLVYKVMKNASKSELANDSKSSHFSVPELVWNRQWNGISHGKSLQNGREGGRLCPGQL